MGTEKTFSQIFGENLKKLRDSYGETQDDIAYLLDCSNAAVCRYETGDRTLHPEQLKVLAEHYDVPVEYFYKENEVPDMRGVNVSWPRLFEWIRKAYPMPYSQEAMGNPHFAKMYAHTRAAVECFRDNIPKINDATVTGHILAAKAELLILLREDEVLPEAALMVVWYLMVCYSAVDVRDEDMAEKARDLLKSGANYGTLMKEYVAPNRDYYGDEIKRDQERIVKDENDLVVSILKFARKARRCEALVDYYNALRYTQNYVDNGRDKTENFRAGIEMIQNLCDMGNPYATYFSSIEDDDIFKT